MDLIIILHLLLVVSRSQSETLSQLTSARPSTSELSSEEIRDTVLNMATTGEDKVSEVLRLIESQRKNCTPGTELEIEGVVDQYGVKKFSGEAQIALNRANLLTRLWKYSPDIFYSDDLLLRNQTEYLLYAAVRNMVELNENIYSAGNCYDLYRYPHYDLFCPFATRTPAGEIQAKDLSISYIYDDSMEWFGMPKKKGVEAIQRAISNSTLMEHTRKGLNCFRNQNVTEEILIVNYEDGHWSKPYYDCGGGNIWMMTYTVPFFGFNRTTQEYHYMGTSGIDIDLRKVDIDQCPQKPGNTDKNVFAGSAKCKPTTQCEPISGQGFSRGSYVCRCVLGYYFPDRLAYDRAQAFFNGTIIEQELEKMQLGLNNSYDTGFVCLPCAEGCTEGCKDNRPCIAALNWTLRTAILVAAIIVMACLPVLFYFTFQYAEVKVLRAASPVLLRMVLIGALLLYGPIIVLFPVPTFWLCTARLWFRGIGFSVSYGALLLKTWRISVVFRVRSAQRVKITDNNLIKRLCLIVLTFASYLTIRTVVSPPVVIVSKTDQNLKAFLCSTDYWDYCQAGGELIILLWGIKLCFVVRKAPSEFNESKFISWAIYNEFLLSLFLNISMLFLQKYADPDLLYIIFFAHSQLTTTVVLVLLFGSKAYMVYKGLGKGPEQTTAINPEPTRSSNKFIIRKKSNKAHVPLTSSTASNANTTNNDSYKTQLPGHLTPAEIQEEFKRLYLQLELLKSKNMRLGNPHLTKRLCAMTEAALATDHSLTVALPATPPTPSSPSNETGDLLDDCSDKSKSADDLSIKPDQAQVLIPNSVVFANGPVNSTSYETVHFIDSPLQPNHVTREFHPNFDLRNNKKAFEITI